MAARNSTVEHGFFDCLPKSDVRILDLASGAGSTMAALSRALPGTIEWVLSDYDPALLQRSRERCSEFPNAKVETLQLDLNAGLQTLPWGKVDAVTTSAFLDLVSVEFVDRLVEIVMACGVPFLASLTYDGRVQFSPEHPADPAVHEAHDQHQITDKGFGAALGPGAADYAIAAFKAAGANVVSGRSDWRAGPDDVDFLLMLLDGWRSLAESCGGAENEIADWWADRHQRILSGTLELCVGHLDFVVLPKR
nr:class I SAM-dependent methyltransferase [Roseibium denhamense]